MHTFDVSLDVGDIESFGVTQCADCRVPVGLAKTLAEVDGEVRSVSVLVDAIPIPGPIPRIALGLHRHAKPGEDGRDRGEALLTIRFFMLLKRGLQAEEAARSTIAGGLKHGN